MAEPNRERPLCVFCYRFRGRQPGTYANVILEASSDVYFVGIFACKYDLCRHWRLPYSKYLVYFLDQIVLMFMIL